MVTLTEQNRMAEFLISEAEHFRARESGIVEGGAGLVAGTVLGKKTAGGNYAVYNPANSDGTENVAAVLFEGVVGTDKRTLIVRESQVKASKLTWFTGADAGQITTGHAALVALGLIVR